MKVARCRDCGQTWSILPDGTLVEHPGRSSSALLGPGSRTSPGEEGPAGHFRYLDESPKQQEALRN
jgi:hypothetical protein